MADIGKINRLKVNKCVDFGVYLDADNLGEILLPKRYVPQDCALDDWIEVFIYRDSDDLLIATTEKPLVMVEQCAYLKVVDVNQVGAFMDWGLSKDLFVPFSEQQQPMKPGRSYVVFAYLSEIDNRISASSKLHKFLNEESNYFDPNEEVSVLICGQTEMGYKAVINDTHLGLIYKNEVLGSIHTGQKHQAYIKCIREDGKIDLSLNQPSELTRDTLSKQILEYLKQHDGVSELTDKSSPDAIFTQFAVSKSSYKKALGKLYKERLIDIDKNQIKLT